MAISNMFPKCIYGITVKKIPNKYGVNFGISLHMGLSFQNQLHSTMDIELGFEDETSFPKKFHGTGIISIKK
jgi:hypothetical protein